MWEKEHENSLVTSKFRVGNFAFLKKKDFDCIESYSAIKTILRLSLRYKDKSVMRLMEIYPTALEAMVFYKDKLEEKKLLTTSLTEYIQFLTQKNFLKSCDYGDRALKELIRLDSVYKKTFSRKNHPYLLQDYRHIISSSSFRRLQDKAQVYSLEEKDFVRTRLTHSIEVSSLAEDIARNIDFHNLFTSKKKSQYFESNFFNDECALIVRCASLIHDIGNPPFGHYGEDAINSFFNEKFKKKKFSKKIPNKILQNDLLNFDGNAQSLRIVDKLQYFGNKCGLLLPASILGAIIKYPFGSESTNRINGKLGYFQSERNLIEHLEIFGTYIKHFRNPLSLILEVADDISYVTSDLEDAIHKKYVKKESFSNLKSSKGKELSIRIENYYTKAIKETAKEYDLVFEEIMRVIIADLKNDLIIDSVSTFMQNSELIIHKGINIDPSKLVFYDLLTGFRMKKNEDYKHPDDKLKYSNKELIAELKEIMNGVYKNNDVVLAEIAGKNAIDYLLEEFFHSILDEKTELNHKTMRYENSNNKYYDKILSLISTDFVKSHQQEIVENRGFEQKEWDNYCRLRLIIDYISGMTDNYIADLYNKLKGK